MKLKIYDKSNAHQITRQPAVRITHGGVIYFNTSAVDLMSFEENSRISIAQDEENPRDWYVFRSADGLELKSKSGTAKSIGVACSFVAAKIRESVGIKDKKNFSLEIAPKPTQHNGHMMWALLTSKPRQ